MHGMPRVVGLLGTWLLLALGCIAGCSEVAQRRDHVARVELLALLQTLNADLLSHDSATLTLERWCAEHRLAEPARITATRVRDAAKPIPDDMRAQLAIETTEPIAYRHVQLVCGDHVLSEADNWYVPGRLTAAMNERLENSDEPFGKVVRPLGFQRHTLTADLLWSPLPAHWEMQRGADESTPLPMPSFVLRHVAVLRSQAHTPFSVVVENYTNELFAFRTWNSGGIDLMRRATSAEPAPGVR
jgi:chorismate-pyruvate lyase